jgi:hypothetical protein
LIAPKIVASATRRSYAGNGQPTVFSPVSILWPHGTKRHGYYAKYRTGMTVGEAVKAGVPRGYIAWDVAHGFITLKPEG